MSVFKELERHGDQGWTYSNSYDRSNTTSSVFNNSAASVDNWPSPLSQQCVLTGVSTPGSADSCVQEIKSSDTDSDDVLLVDDPGGTKVSGTPSQQNHPPSPVFQSSFGSHSPHGLPYIRHAQPQLYQHLSGPQTHHNQSGYFHQHPYDHTGIRHMQLPVSVIVDHGMHPNRKDFPQHNSNHPRNALFEHRAQQAKSKTVHLQGSVLTDLPHQQQQNSRLEYAQHPQRFMSTGYVEHLPQHQLNSHPVHSPLPIVAQTPQNIHGNGPGGEYTHRRHSMTGAEQTLSSHSTFGKHQLVTLPDNGNVPPHPDQKGRREQQKDKMHLPDNFASQSHGDHQRHGTPISQHHNPHHPANPGMRQTQTTPTTDSSSSCRTESSAEAYQMQGGGNMKTNMVYRLTNTKTGTVRQGMWDGKQMVPADSSSPHVQQRLDSASATGESWDRSQLGRAESGQGQGMPHNNTGGFHLPPNHQGPEQGFALHPMANSQPVISGTALQPSHDNSVSAHGVPASQLVKAVPRFSATNEVWPTPMPSRKTSNTETVKEERGQSPETLPDLHVSSESQSSVDSQVIEVSPPQENNKEPKTQTAPLKEQLDPCTSQASCAAEQESNSARIKRKLKEDEEAYAICRYCGYSSTNVDFCEGCHRKLPSDVKICIKKRRSMPEAGYAAATSSDGKTKILSSTSAVDKKAFYGTKLKTQAAAFGNKMEEIKKPQRGHGPSTTPRRVGRGKKVRDILKEQVVVLSSDEEESSKADGTPQTPSSTNTGSVSSASQQDDDDMPFFPSHSTKPTAFGKSRRERMQDEAGRCQSAKHPGQSDELEMRIQAQDLIAVRGVRIGTMRCSGNSATLLSSSIHFNVTSDRTGEEHAFDVFVPEIECIKFTLSQMQPVCFIQVSPACGTRLRERLKLSLQTHEYFDPGSQDPKKNLIVVIIETVLNEEGLRHQFAEYQHAHSEAHEFLQEMDFDEANSLLVKSTPPVLNNLDTDRQLQLFTRSRTAGPGKNSPTTLSVHSSQCSGDYADAPALEDSVDLGTPSNPAGDAGAGSPCVGNKDEPMPSRSPSPKIGFVGPVEKLLTYPPPPAKGGITITNEDLYCLNEGEFLNDVILDFYLKYLFREKLSEEDRQRTHIFSSFFYKRLMQRQSRSLQDAEDIKLTPAQRRHSRVKTWTRHVDIFEKDFLLIPINEHSHWFLAVICFPGLGAQDYQEFEPTSPTVDGSPSDGSNENGNCKMSESPCGQDESVASGGDDVKDEPMDTIDTSTSKLPGERRSPSITGRVVPNAEKTSNEQTGGVALGVKQACILILDSLAGPSRNGIIKILKEYLQVEWDLKKKTPRLVNKTVRGGVPRVPQQTNYSDCGVFVLQYAESFFENPICDFSIPMKGLSRWFPLSKVEKKREEIRNLILKLKDEAS